MTIGLHHVTGSMDELTGHIKKEVPLCILFANDIVLVNESRDGVNT